MVIKLLRYAIAAVVAAYASCVCVGLAYALVVAIPAACRIMADAAYNSFTGYLLWGIVGGILGSIALFLVFLAYGILYATWAHRPRSTA